MVTLLLAGLSDRRTTRAIEWDRVKPRGGVVRVRSSCVEVACFLLSVEFPSPSAAGAKRRLRFNRGVSIQVWVHDWKWRFRRGAPPRTFCCSSRAVSPSPPSHGTSVCYQSRDGTVESAFRRSHCGRSRYYSERAEGLQADPKAVQEPTQMEEDPSWRGGTPVPSTAHLAVDAE